jgi:peptide/nickel transport system ATP-binding protein
VSVQAELAHVVDAVTVSRAGQGAAPLVDGVGFEVRPGSITGVVGETGAGKTLTMRALLGLLPAGLRAGGSLTLAGRPPLALADVAAVRAQLGRAVSCVLQSPQAMLDPLQRVERQLREGVVYNGLATREQAAARARELLAAMGFADPEVVLSLYPHQLSGGMAQRVATALGMMPRPQLLLLDEPTSALDAHVRLEVLELLRATAQAEGTAVVMISHDLGLVDHFCDELVVLHDGKAVERGPTARVVDDPAHPYTAALLRCSATFEATPHEPLPTVAGAAPAPAAPATAAPRRVGGERPIVRATEVTVEYRRRGGRLRALDGVSFELRRGETLAVVGESGAGKSTLVRLLAGFERPAEGAVEVDGAAPVLRAGAISPVQVVFQHPAEALNPYASIGRSVAEPLRKLPAAERRRRVAELLEQVGLDPARVDARPSAFSGGQLQRVVLARALASDPAVLVCDEATSALDVSVQAQIANLVMELQAQRGFACLLVTHDLGLAHVLADDVLVLRDGRAVELSPAPEFFAGPSSAYARDLLAATRDHQLRAPARRAGDTAA